MWQVSVAHQLNDFLFTPTDPGDLTKPQMPTFWLLPRSPIRLPTSWRASERQSWQCATSSSHWKRVQSLRTSAESTSGESRGIATSHGKGVARALGMWYPLTLGVYVEVLLSKFPWTLGVHGPKIRGGRLHEAICTSNVYTHEL